MCCFFGFAFELEGLACKCFSFFDFIAYELAINTHSSPSSFSLSLSRVKTNITILHVGLRHRAPSPSAQWYVELFCFRVTSRSALVYLDGENDFGDRNTRTQHQFWSLLGFRCAHGIGMSLTGECPGFVRIYI